MVDLVIAVLTLYMLLVLVRAVFSWLPPEARENQFHRFLVSITEPALEPVRRILPPTHGWDFSPLIVLVILAVIVRLLGG